MSGDGSGREGFDSFTEDLRVFRHHKVLPLESLLLVLWQRLEDGVFLNEVVEFSELLIEFGFLIDYPLLVRCVCHWCLSLLRRLPAPNGEQAHCTPTRWAAVSCPKGEFIFAHLVGEWERSAEILSAAVC